MEHGVNDILHLASAASTNDVAREAAEKGAAHGWAVRADVQTAGRGQRGHGWTSPSGGLYLSVVVRPRVDARLMGGVTLACGVGCARALAGLGAKGLRLKWPNDLVIVDAAGTRKLGGILVEAGNSNAVAAGAAVTGSASAGAAGDEDGTGRYAVCGVGVNRTTPAVERPMPHALEAIGLDGCLSPGTGLPSLEELAQTVRDGIVDAVDGWSAACARAGKAATPLTGILDEYLGLLAFKNERADVFARSGEPLGAGVLLGVDAWGRALVQREPGELRAIDPSEASIRPMAPAPLP